MKGLGTLKTLAMDEKSMSDLQYMRVDGLHERHPGLKQALADAYAEAGSVCWSRHYPPPVTG